MKISIILLVSLLISFKVTSKETSEMKVSLDELKSLDINIYKALVEKIKGAEDAYSNLDNNELWFAGKLRMKKANKCLGYLLTIKDEELRKRSISIYLDFIKTPENEKKNKEDFSKMMKERKLRRRLMEYDKIDPSKRYELCPFKIGVKTIAEYNKKSKRSKKADTKPDMSLYNVNDQKILKEMMEKNKMTFGQSVKFLLTRMYPILESKARLEFVPNLNEKCPGVVEETWKKCEGRKEYTNLIFKTIPKMYCILDHKDEIDPKCL